MKISAISYLHVYVCVYDTYEVNFKQNKKKLIINYAQIKLYTYTRYLVYIIYTEEKKTKKKKKEKF